MNCAENKYPMGEIFLQLYANLFSFSFLQVLCHGLKYVCGCFTILNMGQGVVVL